MLHRLTHDDRMRLLRATLPETGSDLEQVSPDRDEPPVQLSRAMINRAGAVKLPSHVLPSQLLRRQRGQGAMRAFLRLSRELHGK